MTLYICMYVMLLMTSGRLWSLVRDSDGFDKLIVNEFFEKRLINDNGWA